MGRAPIVAVDGQSVASPTVQYISVQCLLGETGVPSQISKYDIQLLKWSNSNRSSILDTSDKIKLILYKLMAGRFVNG